MPRKIGYARVSTEDQNLDMQLDALQKEACDLIFQEHASGSSTDRKELTKALNILEEGDTLIFWSIDRLGRDANHISNIIYNLNKKKINIRGIKDQVDSNTPMGRLFISFLAHLGEIEVDKIRMRTRAGHEAARKRGAIFGRPRKNPLDPIVLSAKHLAQNTNMPKKKIALELGISRTTLYEFLRL